MADNDAKHTARLERAFLDATKRLRLARQQHPARPSNANDHLSYLQDPVFSDFAITCEDGVRFEVHRNIISNHSKYFAQLCRSDFKEGTARSVTLRDDPPLAIRLMVEYFYTFTYTDDTIKQNSDESISPLLAHAWVYIAADKYDVPELKAVALRKFARQAEADVKFNSVSAGEDFVDVVPYIYDHLLPLDDALRRAAVDMWCYSDNAAIKASSEAQWRELLERCPIFGSDLIKHLGGSGPSSHVGEPNDWEGGNAQRRAPRAVYHRVSQW
ncbi:hypothetical protein LTR36_002198 [Oleoguttula mirabilis]|uniref:BTB domain-containing protein n=1 Tax=Oleoguttula mirabilis TaxID=1507867 RepID=A0AAV9JM93_9PEZI|nr:hypothetical protein LTR36_002198 [Oleoguttula mirabilis]